MVARGLAEELCKQSSERQATARRLLGECLALADRTCESAPLTAERLRHRQRLSGLVGRSAAIDEAIMILVDRYGVSRGQAFNLLRSLSQRRNCKLRDVAEQRIARQG